MFASWVKYKKNWVYPPPEIGEKEFGLFKLFVFICILSSVKFEIPVFLHACAQRILSYSPIHKVQWQRWILFTIEMLFVWYFYAVYDPETLSELSFKRVIILVLP